MTKVKVFAHEKRKVYFALIITAILLALIFVFADFSWSAVDFRSTSDAVDVLEQKLKNGEDTSGDEFVLVGVDGKVIQSTLPEYEQNMPVDLDELISKNSEYDSKYIYLSRPYVVNGEQTATLVARMPATDDVYLIVISTLVGVIGIPLLVLLILVIVQYVRFKNNTEKPVVNLHKAIAGLVNGNYEKPIEIDGEDEELTDLFRDVELLRQELAANTENERQLRSKEKLLLASLTHDLKTPLSVISACAECLRDGIGDEEVDYPAIILARTERIKRLIDDILESTRTELSDFKIEQTSVDAQSYFKRELKQLRTLAEGKNITIEATEIPDERVFIDEFRVSQVLQNLFSNAVKFSPENSTIYVSFGQKDGFLSVSVRDCGCGIAAEDLPFVFDKFYRAEKARSDESIAGNGLGLSIAKSLVEKHGGTIRCESIGEAGAGSTFIFTLPIVVEV